jgi:hypothetical protein
MKAASLVYLALASEVFVGPKRDVMVAYEACSSPTLAHRNNFRHCAYRTITVKPTLSRIPGQVTSLRHVSEQLGTRVLLSFGGLLINIRKGNIARMRCCSVRSCQISV